MARLARASLALTAGVALLVVVAAAVPAVARAPTTAVALAGPVAATPARRAAALRRSVRIGIGDQKLEMFSDARFLALHVRYARLSIGWDALSSPWQVQEIDEWLDAARAGGVQPLVSIGHSRTARRTLPTPQRLRYEFRRLRERYPWVTTWATWNEANHCGEPTCHRPRLVAAYYRALRRECPSCTILAPEMLDMPNMTHWARSFRRWVGWTPMLWGVHNYVEANRFRMSRLRALLRALPGARVWLTETGGLVRRDNASTTHLLQGSRHAEEVTRYIFDRVLPANPQVTAVYLYHWNAGPPGSSWDSGLVTAGGRERSALLVLRRVLRFGLRPHASFRSPVR